MLPCFESLTFDNRYVRLLPADPEPNVFRRQVSGACYSHVQPRVASQPKLVAYSDDMAQTLGLSASFCQSEQFTQIFAGNQQLAGMEPFAMCYGGHQFGQWAGQLGDGRAINLCEVVRDEQRWVLQLKGAGETPYSRSADGLAVLRSSIREFLCSEAMYYLGIPTTRALSLVTTGDSVIRDMLYNGNPAAEPGAVVCRVSPSFIRFGHFEIFAARRELDILRQLVDYTVRTDFPEICAEDYPLTDTLILRWFEEVCLRTADLMVHWQRVGFVHGVMNTDNMSILGLTIDYGPYGWLDNYDPHWTPNTTDATHRRYRFSQQPEIAFWNLTQLANAIYPLINDAEPFREALNAYNDRFNTRWADMMTAKLGLPAYDSNKDSECITELLQLLSAAETDMTLFFRLLADMPTAVFNTDQVSVDALIFLSPVWYREEAVPHDIRLRWVNWLKQYAGRLQQEGLSDTERKQQMNRVNPKYVLRNYLSQQAIEKAEQGDFSEVNELLNVMKKPYDEQPDKIRYAEKRPDWARHKPGCSMLSCSS